MKTTQVPTEFLPFHAYVVPVNNHLQKLEPDGTTKRGITLGLTSEELVAINDQTKKWTTGDPANPGIYELNNNAVTQNSITIKNANDFIENYRLMMRPLLGRMNFSPNITNADRKVLNILPPATSHTKRETPITDDCTPSLLAIAGGSVKVVCKFNTDSTRASKAKGSNAVEYAYRTDMPVLETTTEGGGSMTVSKVRPTVLAHVDDGTTKGISTKATFILQFGSDKASYTLHIYTRWIHTSYPNLAGPWTGPFRIILT